MIIEFAKYTNVKGIPKIPVKGDWVITTDNLLAKITNYDKWYNNYSIEYQMIGYSGKMPVASGTVCRGIRTHNLKHFGSKEEMETILTTNKYNL